MIAEFYPVNLNLLICHSFKMTGKDSFFTLKLFQNLANSPKVDLSGNCWSSLWFGAIKSGPGTLIVTFSVSFSSLFVSLLTAESNIYEEEVQHLSRVVFCRLLCL